MRIGIQTWGTSGDIKPLVNLAIALGRRGHEVTMYYTSVENLNYEHLSFGIENVKIMAAGQTDCASLNLKGLFKMSPDQQVTAALANFFPVLDDIVVAARRLCEENDLVIGTPSQFPLATAAEKNNLPFVTIDFVHQNIPEHNIPTAVRTALNALFLGTVNTLRMAENLNVISDIFSDGFETRQAYLVAVSKVFCDVPDDRYTVCGFFTEENNQAWELPESLTQFLMSDVPTVLMTVGGAVHYEEDARDIFNIFSKAAELCGCNAIVQTVPDLIAKIPDHPRIYKLGPAPHTALLHHCAAVVHHGSAGMASTVTSGGLPSVVVEYAFDQAFWGKELQRIGVAGETLHRKTLTARVLARAMNDVLQNKLKRTAAQQCGNIISEEKGIDKALRIIETLKVLV